MRYKISHTTKYAYTDAVPICHNRVHLTPRECDYQRCDYHRLVIQPSPAERGKRTDYFGNLVEYFSIHGAHRGRVVTARSRVTVQRPQLAGTPASPAWDEVARRLRSDRSSECLGAYQFVFDSPSVPRSPELAQYARPSFRRRRGLLESVRELTSRIHADFVYDPEATGVGTPLAEVFRQRRGVCQDFAHLQIGCLRSMGLAARYVSGYLRTEPPAGRRRLIGADASHAWLGVYCGAAGWVDFDPTNDVMPTTDHITVAWGRDYNDVCPIQGVFIGGGQHSVSVAVDVLPLDG